MLFMPNTQVEFFREHHACILPLTADSISRKGSWIRSQLRHEEERLDFSQEELHLQKLSPLVIELLVLCNETTAEG